MKCTLTNKDNNLEVIFYDGLIYRDLHGATTPTNDTSIANINNHYRLLNGSPFGIYTNPNNNNIFMQGIDEDGATFHSNYYNSRVITIAFDMPKDENLQHLNSVLYMTNKLLELKIETDISTYYVDVAVNGLYDNGILELTTESIFFTVPEQIIERFQLDGKPFQLLPLTMPKKFFGYPDINASIEVFTNVPTYPTISLSGQFTNAKITNRNTGSQLYLPFTVNINCTIDTKLKTVNADYNNVTHLAQGFYPLLVSGYNTIDFEFSSRYDDTVGMLYFQKQVFSVV